MFSVRTLVIPTLGRTAVAGAALCAAGASALAHDELTVLAQANPCAIYGSGFVPVHGTTTCARIGGRVRLESEFTPGARAVSSPSPSPFNEGALGFAPNDDGASRVHLRAAPLPGSSAPRVR